MNNADNITDNISKNSQMFALVCCGLRKIHIHTDTN